MKSTIKLLIIYFLLNTNFLFSQFNVNNLSLEIGYGYNGTISPYNKMFNSNFSGFNHFEVGLRYMFTEFMGTKLIFKSDKFVNDSGGSIGIQYNSIGASFVYNAGKKIGLTYLTRDNLGLLTHIDGSYVYANPLIVEKESETVTTIGVGITPMYRLNDKIALISDVTYNFNFGQHYGFDGFLLGNNKEKQNGKFYTITFGLIYYIGENKYHSDWY